MRDTRFRNRYVIYVLTALLALLHPSLAMACLNHEAGGHALWLNASLNSRQMGFGGVNEAAKKNKPGLKLNSPSMLRAALNTTQPLKVAYHYPGSLNEAKIQLSVDYGLGPAISLAETTVSLDGQKGEHVFMLEAKKPGTYRLRVTAKDLSAPDLGPVFHTVFVSISDS